MSSLVETTAFKDNANAINIGSKTQAGKLGVVGFAGAHMTGSPSAPTGWAEAVVKVNEGAGTDTDVWAGLWYRELDGTEGTVTVPGVSGGNRRMLFWRLGSTRAGLWVVDDSASAEVDGAGSIACGEVDASDEGVAIALVSWAFAFGTDDDAPTIGSDYTGDSYWRFNGFAAYRELAAATADLNPTVTFDATSKLAASAHAVFRRGPATPVIERVSPSGTVQFSADPDSTSFTVTATPVA